MIRSANVCIAGRAAKPSEYRKYQVKNLPATVDLGVTVVMGRPFPKPFSKGLARLVDELSRILSQFPRVVFHAYKASHFHATVAPVRRTDFDLALYERAPGDLTRKQRRQIDARPVSRRRIRAVLAEASPFEIEVCNGRIEITGRGEVLLWGSARSREDRRQLASLRKELRARAGCDGRDQGHAIHVTLGAIQGFRELTRRQKEEITRRIREFWDSEPHQRYLAGPGIACIRQVSLVYYRNRSLRSDFRPAVTLPLKGT